jgi:hypothetical protein
MKNGIEPPKRWVLHFRQKLAIIHKYQEQIYEAALKRPLIIAGKKKILAETGSGEPPDACMNLLYVMFAFLDAEK